MWRETDTNPVNFCNWMPVLPISGKTLPISAREIGISVLFILHVDIINIVLHRCPVGDLGEVPVLDSPVYCLTLVYIFKYVLPSCAQEKLLEPSVCLLLSHWRLGLRGNSKMTQNSFSRPIFLREFLDIFKLLTSLTPTFCHIHYLIHIILARVSLLGWVSLAFRSVGKVKDSKAPQTEVMWKTQQCSCLCVCVCVCVSTGRTLWMNIFSTVFCA